MPSAAGVRIANGGGSGSLPAVRRGSGPFAGHRAGAVGRATEIPLTGSRQAQVVRADVPGQHRQPGEMRLQPGGAGAAIDIDDRGESQIEDIHRHLQHAHVGVDSGDGDLARPLGEQPLGQRAGNAGEARLEINAVRLGQRRDLRGQVDPRRILAPVPVENAPVGAVLGVLESREEDAAEVPGRSQCRDPLRDHPGEVVEKTVLDIDDEQDSLHTGPPCRISAGDGPS
jgi:hypothetical protein